MVRGSLSHIDLTVTDLKNSVAFYEGVLGRLGYRRLDGAGAGAPCWGVSDAHGGFFTIALKLARPEGTKAEHNRYAPGLHHIAFHADSREDVNEFHAFLIGSGRWMLDRPMPVFGWHRAFFTLVSVISCSFPLPVAWLAPGRSECLATTSIR